MRISKPIIFNIPNAFVDGLNIFLAENNPQFKYDINCFYYIAHHILECQIMKKHFSEDYLKYYVPLNKKILKKIIPYHSEKYKNYLLTMGMITCDESYLSGIKSKGYIINEVYLGGHQEIEVKSGNKMFDNIIYEINKEKAHYNRLPSFLKLMRNEMMKIELDYPKAIKWALNQEEKAKMNSYLLSIEQIRDKRFRYFKRNSKNNRLDTNFTNLKKEIRNMIEGDYVAIDLKNAQPFLLNQLFKVIVNNKQTHEVTLCSQLYYNQIVTAFGRRRVNHFSIIHQNQNIGLLVDLSKFESQVNSGTFYDDFVSLYPLGNPLYPEGITRETAKEIMIKVLYSNNTNAKGFIPYASDKKIFAKVYPHLYACLETLKENDNSILPVFLQRIESYIFIDCVAKRLCESGIIPLTIHDSIIIKSHQQNEAMEILEDVFIKNFGVIPKFHVKPLWCS